ncbi:hypothetical protein V8E51_019880 [Hyaloscypha variabilis]
MVISTYPPSASTRRPTYASTSTHRNKLWDPCLTLRIINTDPGYNKITCVGNAPSKGRRCRNGLSNANVARVERELDEIACLSPRSLGVRARLRSIAMAGLCVRLHQGQVEDVVRQWERMIGALDVEAGSTSGKRERATRVKKQVFEQDVDDLKERLREMQELLEQFKERERERTSWGYAREEEQAEKMKGEQVRRERERKVKREEEERLERQRVENERKENERTERERKAKREAEERLEKEQRLENERLENERKEKEIKERERRQREEAAKREAREHNERIRQRAQKIREEKERIKREAERRAEEEWEESWNRYQERWALFRSSTAREGCVKDVVPWPVKSGLYADVKASNVEAFLKRSVKRDANPSRLLRKELSKWHPHVVAHVLGGLVLTDAERMVIDLICRVLTGLMDAVNGKRSELFD